MPSGSSHTSLYDETLKSREDEEKKEEWNFVKYYIINKVRQFLHCPKHGGYWIVAAIKEKLNKLGTTDIPQVKFIKKHLRKTGYTWENYNKAEELWNIKK